VGPVAIYFSELFALAMDLLLADFAPAVVPAPAVPDDF
jgi:hypothetical protein